MKIYLFVYYTIHYNYIIVTMRTWEKFYKNNFMNIITGPTTPGVPGVPGTPNILPYKKSALSISSKNITSFHKCVNRCFITLCPPPGSYVAWPPGWNWLDESGQCICWEIWWKVEMIWTLHIIRFWKIVLLCITVD